jgi:hypothetical protein
MKKQVIFFILIMVSLQGKVLAQSLNPVFNAFKQGYVDGGGNCASIAIIKTAVATFGVNKVFLLKTNTENGFAFTLRDGTVVTISNLEIKTAIDSANFVQKNTDENAVRIKGYADTCFAVMCKHLQNMTISSTFTAAIDDLNDGYNTPTIDKVLGVKFRPIEPHRANKIEGFKNMVITNPYHAIYASEGYYDESRNVTGIEKISNLKIKRAGIRCGFLGCGVSGAYQIVN